MGGTQAGSAIRGNQADYMLGTSEGWDAFILPQNYPRCASSEAL
jgi:hypothetical protein